ncbi:MAG: hypothetical protein DCC71_05070 [Proteobacteria bacterium]|nr:MAG: hypothetical protein DCC71_05070 [Pseudomonadota bacterium]
MGDPFWIEATYRTVGHDPEEIEKTSLYRSLDAKRAQIAKWELDKPCVLCIGGAADAGFSAHRQPMSAEQSAWAFFEDEGGEFISAVVAAPIEIEPEMFTGLKRKAKPRLIENGHAAHRLGNSERETLLRLDFNRWPYSLISQRDVDERSQALAWADERPGYRVEHRDRFDGGCWEFQQGFDLLRIVPRDGLVLLLRRSEIVGEYPSPEQAATMAASLFSMGPPLVFIYERARRERRELYAPVSIEQNRAIVSSDLRAWRWRPGRSA